MEEPDHFQYAKQQFVRLHTTFYRKNIISGAARTTHRNNLLGTIPKSLGRLRSLTVLKLSYNKLTGPIPLSLWSLSKLTNISLNNNALNGTISESHFRSLKILKYLDLSSNKLTYKISSNWTPPFDLDLLKLSHCQIERVFPLFSENSKFYNHSGPVQ